MITVTEALYWLSAALLSYSFIAALTFVIIYSRRRWEATPEGRHLFRFTVVLAVLFFLLAWRVARGASMVDDSTPVNLWLLAMTLVISSACAIELTVRVRLLFREEVSDKENV